MATRDYVWIVESNIGDGWEPITDAVCLTKAEANDVMKQYWPAENEKFQVTKYVAVRKQP